MRLNVQTGIEGSSVSIRVVVSVSTSWSRDVPASRLEKNCQRLSLGRQTSRSRSQSRPFMSRAQDQFSAKLCRPQYAV